MTFLRINGYEIQISANQSMVQKEIEIGSRARGFGGRPILDRRKILREWEGSTCRLEEGEALAHIGAIQGLGEVWDYEDGLFSRGGMPPVSGTDATRRPSVAGDGDLIYTTTATTSELDSRYGSYSLAPAPAYTNLLSSDQADAENAPTGYVALGSTILSADTSNYFQGTKSVKCAENGAGFGLTTSGTSVNSSTVYSGSVYFKTNLATTQIDVTLDGLVTDPATVSIPSPTVGVWHRVTLTGTTHGSESNLKIRVSHPNPVPVGLVMYCDGFQLEQEEEAHSWVDGGVSESKSTLRVPTEEFISNDGSISFCFWCRSDVLTPTTSSNILAFKHPTNAMNMQPRHQAGTNDLLVSFRDLNGTQQNITVFPGTFASPVWRHVGIVFSKPESTVQAVVDGVAGSVFSVTPDYDTSSPGLLLYIGSQRNTGHFRGLLDDLIIAPYAMSVPQIQAIYSMNKAMSPLPRYYIDGDIIPEPELTVLAQGVVSEATYNSVDLDGNGIDEANRVVSFNIKEGGQP